MAKILIIDDERAIRRALREILEFEGYQVDEAENGMMGTYRYIKRTKINPLKSTKNITNFGKVTVDQQSMDSYSRRVVACVRRFICCRGTSRNCNATARGNYRIRRI